MLKKRIKKYICVLSAVIIAFSCFSVSAVETPEFTDNIFLEDLSGYAYYDVFDEDNNFIDTVYVIPDSVDFNPESNLFYIDLFSSQPLKKGYKVYFYCSFELLRASSFDFLIFHFADGLKYNSSSIDIVDYDGSVYNSYFYCYKNSCFYRFSNGKFFTSELFLDVSRDCDSLSLVLEYANNVSDIEEYISTTNAAPRKYKFFSDIGSFFRTAVEWMSDIFNKFVENPAILVLVIGFVIVGFCFGLLRKIIFES